jgi:hypothetical protein
LLQAHALSQILHKSIVGLAKENALFARHTLKMSIKVPTSSQWILFSVAAGSPIWITWKTSGALRNDKYFMSKCYWGNKEKEPKPFDGIEAKAKDTKATKPAVGKYDPTSFQALGIELRSRNTI